MNKFEFLGRKPSEYTLDDLQASTENGARPARRMTREEAEIAIQQAMDDRLRSMPPNQPIVRRSILDILADAKPEPVEAAARGEATIQGPSLDDPSLIN